MDKKEYTLALEELKKAIALHGQFALFYVVRSQAHFRLGNLGAAHKDQDQAVSLSEKDALTMVEVNMQIYEGYLDWAEDYYAGVLLKYPNSWYAYQGRADAYRTNKIYDKAVLDYTRAITINPREARLYLARGKSHAALNEVGKAKKDFQKSLAVTDKLHLKKQAEYLLQEIAASQLL
jgi:tetratricopeptide (TPR) repeat protein